jgi:hypothetical protein
MSCNIIFIQCHERRFLSKIFYAVEIIEKSKPETAKKGKDKDSVEKMDMT